MNIILQLLNGILMIGNNCLDHVVNRNDSDDDATFKDGEVPEIIVGHELHAVIDGCLGMDDGETG